MSEPSSSLGQQGLFVVFEGVDGVGKTTQIHKLAQRIAHEYNRPCVLTSEPMALSTSSGDPPQGSRVRESMSLALHQRWKSSMAQALAFYADRAEHLELVVRPALNDHAVVLSDRFYHSTLVYQQETDPELLNTLQRFVVSPDVAPHLILLITVQPTTRLVERIRQRSPSFSSHFDTAQEELLSQRQQRFVHLARHDQRMRSIDGNASIEDVHESIWQEVMPFLLAPPR